MGGMNYPPIKRCTSPIVVSSVSRAPQVYLKDSTKRVESARAWRASHVTNKTLPVALPYVLYFYYLIDLVYVVVLNMVVVLIVGVLYII